MIILSTFGARIIDTAYIILAGKARCGVNCELLLGGRRMGRCGVHRFYVKAASFRLANLSSQNGFSEVTFSSKSLGFKLKLILCTYNIIIKSLPTFISYKYIYMLHTNTHTMYINIYLLLVIHKSTVQLVKILKLCHFKIKQLMIIININRLVNLNCAMIDRI